MAKRKKYFQSPFFRFDFYIFSNFHANGVSGAKSFRRFGAVAQTSQTDGIYRTGLGACAGYRT